MTFTVYQEDLDEDHSQTNSCFGQITKLSPNYCYLIPGFSTVITYQKPHKSLRYLCQTPKILLYKDEAYVSVSYKKLKRLM